MNFQEMLKEFTCNRNHLAVSLYREISKTKSTNFLMSPLGIESLLAAAYLGATDETAESIRLALGYFPNSHDKIKSAFKIILTELQKCDRFLLVIFNKIYIGNTKCKDDIKKLFKEVFNAHLENIDFSRPDEASDIINACCTEDSQSGRRNLIKIDKLSHKTSAIFVDSLLFAAFWRKQIQSFFTTKKHFYKSENEAVLVDMMQITSLYNYCESRQLNARFLEMSFNDQNVCMIFVVPLKTDGIADLENQLELVFDPPEFKMERVNVVLPKFQISNILYLKEVLRKLGLEKIFSGEADFSGITEDDSTFHIDEIVQKVFMEVDEKGAEVANGVVGLNSVLPCFSQHPPKPFTADRPFIFYVKIKNVIVFAGRVVDPNYRSTEDV